MCVCVCGGRLGDGRVPLQGLANSQLITTSLQILLLYANHPPRAHILPPPLLHWGHDPPALITQGQETKDTLLPQSPLKLFKISHLGLFALSHLPPCLPETTQKALVPTTHSLCLLMTLCAPPLGVREHGKTTFSVAVVS